MLRSLGLVVFVLLVCSTSILAEQPSDAVSRFIAKYGQPDRIESSEYENPRPPIVTKWLIYLKEKVRAVFFVDTPKGSAPPYHGWQLLGVQDTRTEEIISPKELGQRMQGRMKR